MSTEYVSSEIHDNIGIITLNNPKNMNSVNEKMLTELSGKEHFVYTGFTVISKDKVVTESVKSVVKFNNLTKDFIQKYIATGSPLDKAGAYGIQDDGVVENYQGSYFNIVGLPIERLAQILATFGVTGKK